MFAEIIIDIAHTAVDKVFTYHIPGGLCVAPGHLVTLPFGRGDSLKEGFVVSLAESCDKPCKSVLKINLPYPILSEEQLALAEWMRGAYHCLLVDALRLMIPPQLRGARVKERVEKTVRLADGVDAAAALPTLRSPMQREVLDFVLRGGLEFAAADITAFIPGAAPAIRALVKKGLLAEGSHVTFRRPLPGALPDSAPTLTPQQQAATDEIKARMQNGGETVLLHGVTGSGKTEVYLNCIADCLARGRGAIVLVPEIALTPQTVGRFSSRFGDEVAVLHSKLSPGERFDEWRRIRLGKAKIVVGARSAVFAPVEHLGLIVIDEEHEGSYQSDKTPRYHAPEIAQQRVKLSNATLLLGSATPSLTSYYRALHGRYTLLAMPERVLSRPLPEVSVVDMRAEFAAGNNSIFSEELARALSETFARGEQAMLFLNRRGYSTFVSCRSCGYVLKCEQCDVSMTWHKLEGRTRCHYCNAVAPLPRECPACRKPFLKYFGVGTEQVEEQFAALFPHVPFARMDSDTMGAKGAYERLLGAFSRGETQALIGTQMIAKGHDFPNVTLIGVIAADTTLNLPNYLSRERTFQLLTQVSGRSGRDNLPGRVIVQTYSPDHPVVQFSRAHDYPGFFHYELMERKKSLLPPFSLFARVLFVGEEQEEVAKLGNAFARELEKRILDCLGPENSRALLHLSAAPAPIARIQGEYRYQVLVKLLRTAQLRDALDCIFDATAECDLPRKPLVEINPPDMY